MTIIAVTGGTGFVGSHFLDLALAEGHDLRALTRRPQAERSGITWIEGALDQPDSLDRLVAGADAVLHIAGVINAPDRAGFAAGNIAGTRAMIAATKRAGIARFVHVSSIAAREPSLSNYGWSKAEAEVIVRDSDLDWTIVRPPAVFGPRDTEILEIFRFVKRHVMPIPPGGGRMSLIAVDDLIRFFMILLPGGTLSHAMWEPDDGTPGNWGHRDFVHAIGDAMGSKVFAPRLPRFILNGVAAIDGLVRGDKAKITKDRIDYMCHPDWTSHARPPADIWAPQSDTREALAATARWYRAQGLL